MDIAPRAAPRRRQALAFIIEHIARYGISPSCDEVGRALGVSKTRGKQLISHLVREGAIDHVPGAQRALKVRDTETSRDLAAQLYQRLNLAVS